MRREIREITIEIIKWNGSNLCEVLNFCPRNIITVRNKVLSIKTPNGLTLVNKGDYIVRGLAGQFQVCSPDVFKSDSQVNPNQIDIFAKLPQYL